jgi:predicted nucleic acid-binding protein
MRVALDTNVLVYALGLNDETKHRRTVETLSAFEAFEVVIPVQVLGELMRVLTGKARWPVQRAREAVDQWRIVRSVHPTTTDTLAAALDLAVRRQVGIWDAIILNAAAEAGCRLLLSEDYAEGFVWRDVTVANPFATERHPFLAEALGRRGRD